MSARIPVADQLEIEDLAARYNLAIDLGDPDGWVACYTEDGEFAITTVGSWTAATFGLAPGRWRGRSALLEFAVAISGTRNARHWSANRVLTPVGDGLDAVSYMNICYLGRPADDRLLTGIMRDHLRRSADGWHQRQYCELDVR